MGRNPMMVKTDVVNELRNKMYYNELEIKRLIETEQGNYRSDIDQIGKLLKKNVLSAHAIELLESYFAPAPVAAPLSPEQLGLQKV